LEEYGWSGSSSGDGVFRSHSPKNLTILCASHRFTCSRGRRPSRRAEREMKEEGDRGREERKPREPVSGCRDRIRVAR
jgi:hypothetical protein